MNVPLNEEGAVVLLLLLYKKTVALFKPAAPFVPFVPFVPLVPSVPLVPFVPFAPTYGTKVCPAKGKLGDVSPS